MATAERLFLGVLGRALWLCASFALVGLCAVSPALASVTYELEPLAGDQGVASTSSSAPANGLATGAELHYPNGVAVDSSGDAYIADSGNNVVEEVTPSGQLSVIAGTGTAGVPTAGPATGSALNDPNAVAVDSAGNVYIADYQNDVVEKVTPSGVLSIIAGDGSASGLPAQGLATATTIGSPDGLAVDGAGNVYISSLTDSRVFKVTPAGQLSFYAGSGFTNAPVPGPATSSPLLTPAGLAIDSAGNLYIAAYDANEVLKVTPSGTLSIVAGDGGATPPVVGPATSSPLDGPYGLAVDAAGDLYIADTDNFDIEEVTPDGNLSVIAGESTGIPGPPSYGQPATTSLLDFPYAIASTPSGRLYVTDTNYQTVDLLVPPATVSTAPPSVMGTAVVGDTLTADPGVWSNDPVLYAYQWEDCDSSGASCVAISGATGSTYAVASADAGFTIRVVVTAANGGGSASASSAQTAVVPVPPVSSAPVGGAPASGQVSLPTQAESSGLDLTAPGTVAVPVSCSAAGGCEASVTLSVARSALSPGASGSETIAKISGAEVPVSVTTDLKAYVSRAVLRELQASGRRRIQVTVTITNSDGAVSSQQLWLHIPAGLDVCAAPTGGISGITLGPVKLGEMVSTVMGRYLRHDRERFGFVRFCFATPGAFRVQSPSVSVMAASDRASARGHVVLALTANRHYSLDGIRPGTRLARVGSHLELGVPTQGGTNWWYVLPGKLANGVLKVHDGVIAEIGIASKQLSTTAAQRQALFDQEAVSIAGG